MPLDVKLGQVENEVKAISFSFKKVDLKLS